MMARHLLFSRSALALLVAANLALSACRTEYVPLEPEPESLPALERPICGIAGVVPGDLRGSLTWPEPDAVLDALAGRIQEEELFTITVYPFQSFYEPAPDLILIVDVVAEEEFYPGDNALAITLTALLFYPLRPFRLGADVKIRLRALSNDGYDLALYEGSGVQELRQYTPVYAGMGLESGAQQKLREQATQAAVSDLVNQIKTDAARLAGLACPPASPH
jgi:hypothetical protein